MDWEAYLVLCTWETSVWTEIGESKWGIGKSWETVFGFVGEVSCLLKEGDIC